MQGSHITLRQWVQAFYSMCSHKKSVSALQLQRNLGLHSYKSAWYLCHRIRAAMKKEPLSSLLKGIVEVDETYVGGKPRMDMRSEPKRGRGTSKTPVVAMVERYGNATSKPVANVNAETLRTAITEVVNRQATIMTDEWNGYNSIGKDFAGGHKVIKHSYGEYAKGDITTNSVESYFALLKRAVNGTFHHISKKHLAKYCDDFSFRWNFRKTTDGERAVAAIQGIEGKSLPYRKITEN